MHPAHILLAALGLELARGFEGGPVRLDVGPELVEPAALAR